MEKHVSILGAREVRSGRIWLQPRVLDRLEQVIVVVLWSLLVWRVFHSPNGYAPLALLAETMIVLFTLIRRPTEAISVKLEDWFLALTATGVPLLIALNANPFPAIAPLGVFFVSLGNLWQIAAKLMLRRSFGIAPANRGIKVEGLYRFMRHPMYAGYPWAQIGILILMFSPFNLMIYAIAWWAQIKRMLAEERLLSEDPVYREYMGRVRYRLIPGVY